MSNENKCIRIRLIIFFRIYIPLKRTFFAMIRKDAAVAVEYHTAKLVLMCI